ncbi:MAG: phosphoribosylanthranilate isomerase [Pseudomonadota bacterium]
MKAVTKIKICGIKDAVLAYQTAKMGADYIGLMFYHKSKRYIELNNAIDISAATRKGGAEPVAVFVDQDLNTMQQICATANINTVQLHGDIARQQYHLLPQTIQRIYVLHVNPDGDIINADQTVLKSFNTTRDYLLFDGLKGGSGAQINTDKIIPYLKNFRCFVAGGLNADNVTAVIDKLNPYAVDTSSGVENTPGEKSAKRIEAFIKMARKQ